MTQREVRYVRDVNMLLRFCFHTFCAGFLVSGSHLWSYQWSWPHHQESCSSTSTLSISSLTSIPRRISRKVRSLSQSAPFLRCFAEQKQSPSTVSNGSSLYESAEDIFDDTVSHTTMQLPPPPQLSLPIPPIENLFPKIHQKISTDGKKILLDQLHQSITWGTFQGIINQFKGTPSSPIYENESLWKTPLRGIDQDTLKAYTKSPEDIQISNLEEIASLLAGEYSNSSSPIYENILPVYVNLPRPHFYENVETMQRSHPSVHNPLYGHVAQLMEPSRSPPRLAVTGEDPFQYDDDGFLIPNSRRTDSNANIIAQAHRRENTPTNTIQRRNPRTLRQMLTQISELPLEKSPEHQKFWPRITSRQYKKPHQRVQLPTIEEYASIDDINKDTAPLEMAPPLPMDSVEEVKLPLPVVSKRTSLRDRLLRSLSRSPSTQSSSTQPSSDEASDKSDGRPKQDSLKKNTNVVHQLKRRFAFRAPKKSRVISPQPTGEKTFVFETLGMLH